MFELLLCSLLTVFPDYLYRRYAQGKRIGIDFDRRVHGVSPDLACDLPQRKRGGVRDSTASGVAVQELQRR